MSQENDSESEFYYPQDSKYGKDNAGENNHNNAENNNQEQINTFIYEQTPQRTPEELNNHRLNLQFCVISILQTSSANSGVNVLLHDQMLFFSFWGPK